MATATRKRSGFGDILRGQLDDQKISVRELARRLAGDGATNSEIENERRSLIRYLNGDVMPGVGKREEIAGRLGIKADLFAEDALRHARREKLLDALAPLADVLLDLAVEVAEEGGRR